MNAATLTRVAIGVSVASAIVSVWATLRNSGNGAAGVVGGSPGNDTATGGPVQLPAVPSGSATQAGFSTVTPASISPDAGWLNPDAIATAYGSPQSQMVVNGGGRVLYNGTGIQGTPMYPAPGGIPITYISQIPPWKNAPLQEAAATVPQPASAGCQCSGGGGAAGSAATASGPRYNALMDGESVGFLPLYVRPTASPIALWGADVYHSLQFMLASPASVGPNYNSPSWMS